ncbi:helix-turn-helix domain-containing protein [Nonomuraea wenchangensis]|uniref:helix-turn-helix domain-containing protein n=1 Tax=Nonomuraea wenchangensis TaxID=568860 RepID=UPI0034340A3D
MKKSQPQPGFVVQAYRFALDPNVTQEAALRSHCGAARAAYNWAASWVAACVVAAQGRGVLRHRREPAHRLATVVAARAAQGVQRGQAGRLAIR